ncbi:RNA methyltransferase [Brachybacterium muris]|nr:RNA methyltransferase [Brachybacterium muris]MCT1997849.1 RNA methyltransferase [Brachybacterium muris]
MVREGEGSLVTPQGAIAVARLPQEDPAAARSAIAALHGEGPLAVAVLHEVRDPGNVGTLIRTADAAGADLVILTRTSADPYSPKAVRASVGSLFHLPVVTGAEIDDVLASLAQAGITAAATSGYAELDLFQAELPARIGWLLGNEAHGLDQATLDAAPLAVRIPLAGRAESLNVHTAATVCLFETLRRRGRG